MGAPIARRMRLCDGIFAWLDQGNLGGVFFLNYEN